MTNIATPIKKEQANGSSSTGNNKGIENHKKAAEHLHEAAKHHQDAAKHIETGNHSKAYESTLKAHGHNYLANEQQKEVIKSHALSK